MRTSIPGTLATLLGFAALFGALSLWRAASGGFPWLVLVALIGTLAVLGVLGRRGLLRTAAITGTWVGALWALLVGVIAQVSVLGSQDAAFVVATVGALTGLAAGLLVTGSRARMARMTDPDGDRDA